MYGFGVAVDGAAYRRRKAAALKKTARTTRLLQAHEASSHPAATFSPHPLLNALRCVKTLNLSAWTQLGVRE